MSRREQERLDAQRRRRALLAWVAGGAVLAGAAVLAGIVVGGAAGGDGDGVSADVTVSMTDFAFDPDPIVLSGDDRAIKVVNDGTVEHDLFVPELGKGTPELDPGEELTIDFAGQPAGTYQVVCHIDGHSEAGMVTELIIE
ncbi:MAG TPA: cupredoxin domain-containing protein [Acidimicrobiales bacterium]